MSAQWWSWLAAWLTPALAIDTPALPGAALGYVYLDLGWSVVLAWMGFGVAGWLTRSRSVQTGVAGLLALWAWVPGPYAPSHWLALAFQAPSVVTVLLCAWLLRGRLLARADRSWFVAPVRRVTLAPALLGMALGWALLLDTFALLPVQLYAWGFSPAASALVLLLALLPWVMQTSRQPMGAAAWVAPVAVLLFVTLRLPSGNTWDAMLDPWLWVALHGYVARVLWLRY